ncbi:MAG: hypothetical protein WCP77_03880 [Roseococcus sp.]
MKRSKPIQLEHYRGYQIETRDARDGGWVVSISSWEGLQPAGTVLRSDSPLLLAGLLSMARERIDAALAQGDPGVPV